MQTSKSISNEKFEIRNYSRGQIAKRRSDGMQIYFEDRNELLAFIK